MLVERLEVEEGFLDGLDLRFKNGLNVLIGPRGTGKTSIIELIRFGLGLTGHSKRTNQISQTQAASVLAGGRVTVTLSTGQDRFIITRGAEEDAPRSMLPSVGETPIILSQGEIERVGLEAGSRLRLIDGFRADRRETSARESSLVTRIGSLTQEMADICKEIRKTEEQIGSLKNARAELSRAEESQSSALKTLKKLGEEQKQLDDLTRQIAVITAEDDVLERNSTTIEEWASKIESFLRVPPVLEGWADPVPSDALADVRRDVASAIDHLRNAAVAAGSAAERLRAMRAAAKHQEIVKRDAARQLRRTLEAAQEGAGTVARQVAELRERLARLEALERLLASEQARLSEIQKARGEILDDLEATREDKFRQRVSISEAINEELGPRIRVRITRFGLHDAYVSALAGSLRGSQVRYNVVAPVIAERMSPREFVEAVESGRAETIADLADIEIGRATRIVDHLTGRSLQDILTAQVEDSVTLQLLDGKEYKHSENLSTGQRCTVVLPILLRHSGRPVVVDQPEDNLDNAFVVDTLLKAILRPDSRGQLIFATHNPNIPVLGNASNVVLMGADGTHGFTDEQGDLESPAIVDAITEVMEGGVEAFEQRAQFYALHSTKNG